MIENPSDQIHIALVDLAAYVTGLRVVYRSYGMSIYPPNETNDKWEAHANPDAEDCNGYPLDVIGSGCSPMEAVLVCFKACEEAERV